MSLTFVSFVDIGTRFKVVHERNVGFFAVKSTVLNRMISTRFAPLIIEYISGILDAITRFQSFEWQTPIWKLVGGDQRVLLGSVASSRW